MPFQRGGQHLPWAADLDGFQVAQLPVSRRPPSGRSARPLPVTSASSKLSNGYRAPRQHGERTERLSFTVGWESKVSLAGKEGGAWAAALGSLYGSSLLFHNGQEASGREPSFPVSCASAVVQFMPCAAPLQSKGSLVLRQTQSQACRLLWFGEESQRPALSFATFVSSTLSPRFSSKPLSYWVSLCPPSSPTLPSPSPKQSLAHHLTPLIFIVETRNREGEAL